MIIQFLRRIYLGTLLGVFVLLMSQGASATSDPENVTVVIELEFIRNFEFKQDVNRYGKDWKFYESSDSVPVYARFHAAVLDVNDKREEESTVKSLSVPQDIYAGQVAPRMRIALQKVMENSDGEEPSQRRLRAGDSVILVNEIRDKGAAAWEKKVGTVADRFESNPFLAGLYRDQFIATVLNPMTPPGAIPADGGPPLPGNFFPTPGVPTAGFPVFGFPAMPSEPTPLSEPTLSDQPGSPELFQRYQEVVAKRFRELRGYSLEELMNPNADVLLSSALSDFFIQQEYQVLFKLVGNQQMIMNLAMEVFPAINPQGWELDQPKLQDFAMFNTVCRPQELPNEDRSGMVDGLSCRQNMFMAIGIKKK